MVCLSERKLCKGNGKVSMGNRGRCGIISGRCRGRGPAGPRGLAAPGSGTRCEEWNFSFRFRKWDKEETVPLLMNYASEIMIIKAFSIPEARHGGERSGTRRWEWMGGHQGGGGKEKNKTEKNNVWWMCQWNFISWNLNISYHIANSLFQNTSFGNNYKADILYLVTTISRDEEADRCNKCSGLQH